ncbi:MAG: type I methionyl aminopeptidase [Patescibacteria group bacterium]|jgi:methionyl aminopeptidase
MDNILNKNQIEAIKECGKILSQAMDEVEKSIAPNLTAAEIDSIAESAILKGGAKPSFKNYEVHGGGIYPSTSCISINDEIVHGLPTSDKILREGDIVSVDLGANKGGVHTDMARTFAVGKVSSQAQKLIDMTRRCLEVGLSSVRAGAKIGQIGHNIQKTAESEGFGVVRDLVGHGIGPEVHMEPSVPNYGRGNEGPVIVEGMALAIEPMLTTGSHRIKVAPDGWTILTTDGSLAAHFEHTVVVEDGKPVVVTR